MAINGTRFTFTSGDLPEDIFVVVDFDLTQSLSTLFCLKVTLASREPAIGFENLLDETATLTIWQGEEVQRRVRGIVTLCEQGDTGKHQTLYQLTIYPEFWRSGQRQNCRSFQNQDIASIFDTLLREMGITTYEMRCRSPHPTREFCVQFMETDFAFISRLAAEEGICFFEDEYVDSNTQNLVFADHCLSMCSIGPLAYNPNTASEADTYCINHFTRGARIRPAKVTTKDYTFTAPGWHGQFENRRVATPYQRTSYEVFDYPGRFKDVQPGTDFANYQLAGWRNDVDFANGASNSPQLQPGQAFSLAEHPRDELNTGWQIISSQMRGEQPQALIGHAGQGTHLSTRFQAISSAQTWRSQPFPKPCIDGPQIAIVTGPPGEEIFCDEHGRVRVKFAWDRYNKADDGSSCWIRVSQAWAGTGFGNIAVPRVGQEVIVDFLNGDPDQPIITGRTYHASNRAPGSLPGTKTQMAIRSQTYKGNGYNELMFEDATGNELLSMQAQKNMQIKVLNSKDVRVEYDRTASIGHDESLVVANDRKVTVEGKQDHKTTKDYVNLIEGNHHSEVKGDLAQKISGALGISVKGDIVLQSSNKISLRVGSSFLVIHSAGVDIKGAKINLNGGGSPGDIILPMNPAILKAAAGEGSVFFSHCPLEDN